jgi:hypothetical protein
VPSTLVHALLRARLPQRAVIADIATQTICGVTVRTMLRLSAAAARAATVCHAGALACQSFRPSELLPVGGPVTLAFLWCNSCIWEIDQAHLDKPPWSGSRQRYRCPGCSGAVRWHIHGPAWRPFESRDSPWWL